MNIPFDSVEKKCDINFESCIMKSYKQYIK